MAAQRFPVQRLPLQPAPLRKQIAYYRLRRCGRPQVVQAKRIVTGQLARRLSHYSLLPLGFFGFPYRDAILVMDDRHSNHASLALDPVSLPATSLATLPGKMLHASGAAAQSPPRPADAPVSSR